MQSKTRFKSLKRLNTPSISLFILGLINLAVLLKIKNPEYPNQTIVLEITIVLIFLLLSLYFIKKYSDKKLQLIIENLRYANDQLAERDEQLKESQSVAQMVNWHFDVRKEQFIFSDNALQFLSLNDHKVDLKDFIKLIHPEDQDQGKLLKKRFYTKEECKTEFRIQVNKQEIWLLSHSIPQTTKDGTLLTRIGIFQNISQNKLSEKNLLKTQEHLQFALDSCNLGVWQWDVLKNETKLDKRGCLMVGMAYEASFNTDDIIQRIHPDYKAIYKSELNSVRHNDYKYLKMPLCTISDKGEQRWVYVTGIESESVPGSKKVSKMSGIIRDITQEIKHENQRENLENQLAQAKKMDAIGQLAGGIAHDFNNLLQVSLGYSELLQNEAGISEAGKKHLNEIIAANNRAISLIQQLLTFSRHKKIQYQSVNLNDVIKNLSNMLLRTIGDKVVLTCDCQEDLPPINADPTQIEQIIINLCINAKDSMPKGGEISIRTSLVQKNKTEGVSRESILMSVSDSGTGIPKELQSKIFEPFFTTKDPGEGTGLGLATVYGIVDRYKGQINIESETNKGTTINVFLPTKTKELIENKAISRYTHKNLSTEKTILIAEDDKYIRTFSTTILTKAGYTVIEASNGEEAITLTKERQGNIDLLLLDMMMPSYTGKEAFEIIHKSYPDIPVIFCTAYSKDLFKDNYIKHINARILNKPYVQKELLQQIRETLDNIPVASS